MRFAKFVGTFKVSTAGAALAVALAGCTEPTPTAKLPDPTSESAPSTSSAAESSATAPSTSTAPTTTYTPEEQAVIDQYQGYYNAFFALPALEDSLIRSAFGPYATPAAVQQVVDSLISKYAANGWHLSGSVTFGQIEVVINSESAQITECRDGSTELVVSDADNSVVGKGKPATLVEAELTRTESGPWLVIKASGKPNAC